MKAGVKEATNGVESETTMLRVSTFMQGFFSPLPITDPWNENRYIYKLIYHKSQQNVGKYTVHGYYMDD